jgi:DNA polymerase V
MNTLSENTSIEVEFRASLSSETLTLPLLDGISAGFPSPALDFMAQPLDINTYLIKNATATFYARVKGHSMKNAGIDDGDILVVDKSLTANDGRIAICYVDGKFTVKRIHRKGNELWLLAENDAYVPLKIEEETHFTVWGIVTHSIKKV